MSGQALAEIHHWIGGEDVVRWTDPFASADGVPRLGEPVTTAR